MTEQATQYIDLPIPHGIDTATQPELVQPGKALGIRNCHVGNGALIERRSFERLPRNAVTDYKSGFQKRHSEVTGLAALGSAPLIATEESKLLAHVQGEWIQVDRNDSPVSAKKALHSGPVGTDASSQTGLPYAYRNTSIAVQGDYACITWWRRLASDETGSGYAMIYDLANEVVVSTQRIVPTVAIGDYDQLGSNPSLIPVAMGSSFVVLWIHVGGEGDELRYTTITPGTPTAAWSAAALLVDVSVQGVRGTFDAVALSDVLHVGYNNLSGVLSGLRATLSGSTLVVSHAVEYTGAGLATAIAISGNASRITIAHADADNDIFAIAATPATMAVAADGSRTVIGNDTGTFCMLACMTYDVAEPFTGETEVKALIAWTTRNTAASLTEYRTAYHSVPVEHLTSYSGGASSDYIDGVSLCHRPFMRLSGSNNFPPQFLGVRRQQTFEDTFYTFMISMEESADHSVTSAEQIRRVTPVARYSALTAGRVSALDHDDQVDARGVSAVIEYGGRYHWVGFESVPVDEGYSESTTVDTLHIYSLDFSTDRCWSSVTVNGTLLVAGSIPRLVSPEVMSTNRLAVSSYVERGMEGLVPLHSPMAELALVASAASGALTAEGTYYYCQTFEYADLRGRRHRSAPSIVQQITLSVTENQITVAPPTDYYPPQAGYRRERLVIWRSVANPADANQITFYRLVEMPMAAIFDIEDGVSDADLATNEVLYTVSGELPNFPPPPSSALCLWKNRIVALDSETGKVWPSKTLLEREWPGWHEGLAVSTDVHTSLPIFLTEDTDNLIVWWKDAIGIIYGEPGSDTGALGSLTQPRLLGQRGIGLKYVKSLVRTPIGHMFMSRRGIYLLGPDMGLTYIGRDVEAYNNSVIVGAYVAETPNGSQEVRFETQTEDVYGEGYVCLCYDLAQQAWHLHTRGRKPRVAASVAGRVYVATEALAGTDSPWTGGFDRSGVWRESDSTTIPTAPSTDATSLTYTAMLDTPWYALAGILGEMRTRRLFLFGDINATSRVVGTAVFHDFATLPSQAAQAPVGSARRLEIAITRHQCGSIRFLVTGFQRLLAMRLEVQAEKGALRRNNAVG